VLKVAVGHVCDVLAVEEPDLEVFDHAFAFGGLDACGREVVESLEDDFVGGDVLGNFLPRTAMCDEFWGDKSAASEKH
jgi:hypothetical protein